MVTHIISSPILLALHDSRKRKPFRIPLFSVLGDNMNPNRYAIFFIGLFILIAITAVFRWCLLWNMQFSYMDNEFPYWIQQKDYVRTKSDKQEVIFLGDSRMKAAVIPNKLCENAYNLAVGGGTSIEMYYTLKHYLENHPKPEKVILGFAGGHWVSEGQFTGRDLYFHFLSPSEQLEAQYIGYKSNQWGFQRFKEKIIGTLEYELFFPQKYSAALINSKFKRGEFNHSEYEKNKMNKGQMFFGMNERTEDFNGDANINFVPDKRNDFYLHKIINLCKKHNISFFIEQLPMNTISHEKLGETKFYEKFKSYLSDLESETGITVEKAIPCYEPECFGDSSHVNPRGAERFTAEIKEKYGL